MIIFHHSHVYISCRAVWRLCKKTNGKHPQETWIEPRRNSIWHVKVMQRMYIAYEMTQGLVGLNIVRSVFQKHRRSWTDWLLYVTAVNDKMVGFCDHGNILLKNLIKTVVLWLLLYSVNINI